MFIASIYRCNLIKSDDIVEKIRLLKNEIVNIQIRQSNELYGDRWKDTTIDMLNEFRIKWLKFKIEFYKALFKVKL